MTSTFAQLIMFEVILLGFLTMFGLSLGISNIQDTIAQIMGPWPVYVAPSCGWFDFVCHTEQFTWVGQILLWGFSVLFRIGATAFLLYQIITVLNVVTGIPFLGYIFIGFQVLLGVYVLGLFKPGGGHQI